MTRRPRVLWRWLVALLLLAALAWGVGRIVSDRAPSPELGVGDLREPRARDAEPDEPAEPGETGERGR